MEDVETQGLVLAYLHASTLSFLCEDVAAVGLSSWRLWRVCRLSGLTLRDWAQVTMVLQLMFSVLMTGYQVGTMKEKLRLGALQLRKEAKLATVIKASTTGKCSPSALSHTSTLRFLSPAPPPDTKIACFGARRSRRF